MSKKSNSFNLEESFNENQKEEDQAYVQVLLSSEVFKVPLFQVIKYSPKLTMDYSITNVNNIFSQKIKRCQETYQLQNQSIKKFIKLLQGENSEITNDDYCDLYRLSVEFKVEILQNILDEYSKQHSTDTDFIIISLLQYNSQSSIDIDSTEDQFSIQMEKCLSQNISLCLLNSNFEKLPISKIYRVFGKSDKQQINSNLLYDFISKSIEERCILFQFLDLKTLSDERFNEMYSKYSNSNDSNSKKYYSFIKDGLLYMHELKASKKKAELEFNQLKKRSEHFNDENTKICIEKEELENKIIQIQKENDQLRAENCQKNNENEELQVNLSKLDIEQQTFQQLRDNLNTFNAEGILLNILIKTFYIKHAKKKMLSLLKILFYLTYAILIQNPF
ncbi:hypothetical protein M9Y10_030129 [Tritrichomonas musculus]|uniref:Transmembrane protein n=1 Tax=Tritrichomonas musculus TaxID=1915356 RepID=A0ABR2KPY0_9EUKA